MIWLSVVHVCKSAYSGVVNGRNRKFYVSECVCECVCVFTIETDQHMVKCFVPKQSCSLVKGESVWFIVGLYIIHYGLYALFLHLSSIPV